MYSEKIVLSKRKLKEQEKMLRNERKVKHAPSVLGFAYKI